MYLKVAAPEALRKEERLQIAAYKPQAYKYELQQPLEGNPCAVCAR